MVDILGVRKVEKDLIKVRDVFCILYYLYNGRQGFIKAKIMGTRADFYAMKGYHLTSKDWIGSIAWDGYPQGVPKEIKKDGTRKAFLLAVRAFLKQRDDTTFRSDGWPWPWDSSETSDYYYVFSKGKVRWNKHIPPDMSKLKNVALGKRSGLIVMSRR